MSGKINTMKKSELRTIIKEKIASRLYEMKDDSYYNKLVIDIEEGEYDNIGEDWSEEKWDEMEAKFGSYDNWDGVDILASITGLDKDKAYDIWHNREKNIADPEYFSLNENKNTMKKSELKQIIKEEISNSLNSEYNPKDITQMYLSLSDKWKESLDGYFIGKTITTTANKHEGRYSWEEFTIPNIKQVKIGNYFGTDINVEDENGEWYSLLGNKK